MVSKLKLPVGNAFSLPTSCDELLKQLEENCGEPVDLFKYYLKFYLNGNRREQIIDDILPKIYAKAGEVITLFHPNLELEILPENCSGSVSLTRSQIGTLLAHMLFCTLTPMHKNEFKGASDFRCWLTGSMFGKKDPRIAYLDTLFWYFEDLFQLPEARLQEIVKFEV